MGSFSDYLELAILDQIVGKTDYTMPTAYVALCTADPTDAGTGADMNEVADANGYARVTTSGSDWDAASSGATANAAELSFPEASGAWGTVTHFALVDSGTHGAGNMLAYGTLDASKAVVDNDIVKFAIGAFDITLD
jgi:hypothetical protein